MKRNKMKVSVLVLFFFLINTASIAGLGTTAMAQTAGTAAAASAAGTAAGTAAAAGVVTGTIAAGVAIATVVAVVVATSGGEDRVAAAAPTSPAANAGANLASTNPAAATAAATALGTLNSTNLGQLATTNTALGSAGQTSLAQAASSLTQAQFANFNTVASAMGLVSGTPQYTALQNLYSSYTPAQLQALQQMYAAAVTGGQVNQATLQGISEVISTSASGTPAQQAQNLSDAIYAILTARHPGSTVTVTAIHHGNNIYTTVSHVR